MRKAYNTFISINLEGREKIEILFEWTRKHANLVNVLDGSEVTLEDCDDEEELIERRKEDFEHPQINLIVKTLSMRGLMKLVRENEIDCDIYSN